MSKNTTILLAAILAIAIIAVAAFALTSNNNNNNNNDNGGDSSDDEEETFESITVTDLNGHEVTVDKKVERVAVTDLGCLEVFATAYGSGWENVICAMPADTSSRDPSLGNYISKTWPQLSKLPTIPDLYTAFASNPLSVAEAIIDSNPDLVVLTKAYTDYFPNSLDGFYKMLDEAGIPYFHSMFYTSGLTDTIADANIGQLCKLFQKEDRGNEIVPMYNSALKVVTDRMASKTTTTRFYGEIPNNSAATYGTISAYGFPEIDILGYNIQNDYGGGYSFDFNLEKMIECKADWIILISSAYYGDEQKIGYYVEEDEEALAECLSQYLARDGWSELPAVQNNHVCFFYGEFRNSMSDLYDLYGLANIVDKTIVSDAELESLVNNLNKYMPWKIDGTFSYVMDGSESESYPVTVTDPNGHEVTVSKEVERVAITDLSTMEVFATAYGDGWEDVICTMPADLASRDKSLGSYITKTWPNLSSLPVMPDMYTAFATNPLSVAEALIDSNPDLIILPKSYTDYFPNSLDGFYKMLDEAGIPYFHSMFYTAGLTETVADANIGQLCKLLGKEDRGEEIVEFYNSALKVVTDRMASRTDTIRFYGEVPVDPSTYGTVSAYGFPEIDVLGYNIQNDYGGGYNFDFNLEKMIECDADWIVLISTAYYGDKQLTGYFVEEDDAALEACMDQYLARDGWSELDAVKDKHVCFRYGEMRFGICGLYDLYDLANIVDKTIISDEELQDLVTELNKYTPWKVEGTFSYVME